MKPFLTLIASNALLKTTTTTRTYSSRMRTAHSLTVSHSICRACPPHHAHPPAMHAPHHACPLHNAPHRPPCHAHPPTTHTPLPCMPLPHMPPLPCMPPNMHAPHHKAPPIAPMPPPHTPSCHTCPPHHTCPLPCMPPLTEFLTHDSENITLPPIRCGR